MIAIHHLPLGIMHCPSEYHDGVRCKMVGEIYEMHIFMNQGDE